jgi:hypothetical protein
MGLYLNIQYFASLAQLFLSRHPLIDSANPLADRSVAAIQVRMNHVALDRPWPDDRDLDHHVVKTFRFHQMFT